MAGIRVCSVGQSLVSDDLQKHFSSSKYGGGPIEKIYHPLLNGDAVVMFKDASTVDTVVSCNHTIQNLHSVNVHRLPSYQVFSYLDASLSSDVSSYIKATDKLENILQDSIGLTILDDKNETIKLRGTWYQLEQAWKHLDDVMISQQSLHSTITSSCHNPIAGSHEKMQSKRHAQHTTNAPLINPVSGNQTGEGSAKSSTNLKSKIDIKPEVSKEDSKPSVDKEAQQYIVGKPAEDMSSLEFTVDGVKAVVYYGNIVKATTDAIVNAAMGSLVNAGGVAMAIADAAGSKMQKECDDFVKKHGKLETTGVIHTCAGGKLDKRVKYIIHTVGPIWSESRDTDKCVYELKETFLNCLSYADQKLKLDSITLPVISSGIFGVPLEICLKAFLDGFLIFTLKKRNLCEVRVVNNDPNVNLTSIIFLQDVMQSPLSELRSSALSFEERKTVPERQDKTKKKTEKTKSSRQQDSLKF